MMLIGYNNAFLSIDAQARLLKSSATAGHSEERRGIPCTPWNGDERHFSTGC